MVLPALLAAALLCAPSLAAAHSSANVHGHFNISLTPSTITEGQTTTVTFSYSGPRATVFSGVGQRARYATAYIQLSKSAASPTGGGAVNFSTNTRWSWQTYLENRHDNSLGSGEFAGNQAGTVTITPVDDGNITGTRTVTVTGTLPTSTTDYFYGVGDGEFVISTATLTILDNDEATISVSRGTGALALTEGGNATHTVTLAGQPTGAVVVDVTSDDAGAAAVAPASLTYSATTWNTGQAVTVSAVSDADSDDETVTVTHAVNDANSADEFDPAPDVMFTVNVTDNTPYRGEFDSGHGGSTISIAPAELFAVVGPQLLTISSTQATFFNPYTVHLCPFTSVPRSTGASVNGCTTIANRAATNRIDWNVSVTQAMVTNGGFVIMVKQAIGTFSNLVIYANWVPLVTPRTPTLVLAPASITENGGVSTVTATLSSAPTAAVTLTVGAAAVSPAVGGLHAERGGDADLRDGGDDEHGRGDADGGEPRRRALIATRRPAAPRTCRRNSGWPE